MGVKTGHIRATFTTDKFHLPKNLSGILLRRKRAVDILQIMGRNQDIFGNFNKFAIITALLTNNAPSRFTGRYMDFFHRRIS